MVIQNTSRMCKEKRSEENEIENMKAENSQKKIKLEQKVYFFLSF